MANKNCNACNEIRSEVPELVANGFTEAMCTSMKNDTGMKQSVGHDDCEDLDLLNDCLVGNMKDEIEDYDGCDWKNFTKKFIDNLWTLFEAMKCAICGLWTNVHNLWTTVRSFKLTKSGHTITLTSNLGNHGSVTDDDTTYSLSKSGNTIKLTGSDGSEDSVIDSNTTYTLSISGNNIVLTPSSGTANTIVLPMNTKNADGMVAKGNGHADMVWKTDSDGNPAWREDMSGDIQCIVDYLSEGASFSFGENVSGVASKLIPGKGADFGIRNGSSQHTADVTITYVAGGLAILTGSVRTFTESFTDIDGNTKTGNSVWDFEASNYSLPNGGELLYEIRIKKSEYPQVNRFFAGNAWASGANQTFFQTRILFFDGDKIPSGSTARFAYGQHGWCDDDGTPSETGYSNGHAVPAGWMYIQCRMAYVGKLPVYNVKDGARADKRGTDFSPAGYFGIRINANEIEC